MVSREKYWWLCNLKFTKPIISEMLNQNSGDNSVNRTGPLRQASSPGRCFLVRQRGPGRHPATVRTKWSKTVNMIVMECFFRSRPFDDEGKPIREYRQRMMQEWKKHGVFEISEQRLCDQARAIRKNGWLSDLELENIRRMIDTENQIANESTQYVEENQTEEDMIRTSEGNEEIGIEPNEIINNVTANMETIDEETHRIIDKLNDIITSNRNADGISVKKIDMKILKQTTAKVNRVIELIETNNITQTNNLLKDSGVWVADQLGLKKYEGGKKKDPWRKRRIEGDIKHLKKDINILERVKKDQLVHAKRVKLN